MKKLIAGNWKMNGLSAAKAEIDQLSAKCTPANLEKADILICPPAPILSLIADAGKSAAIAAGGQDCHANTSGAHTGDISCEMLKDAGATYVIVGHSERRADHAESDEQVLNKAKAAQGAGLMPIICVGETEAERKSGKAVSVVLSQLKGSLPEDGPRVIAYEPVWAIGTGLVPTLDDIAEMHSAIREFVGPDTHILYGGSVKPGNAAEILTVANVDGALVGGASLKADDFFGIIDAI